MSGDEGAAFWIGVVLSAAIAGAFIGDTVTPKEFQKAEQMCVDSNSNLRKYEQYLLTAKVKCKNEAEFTIRMYQ